MKKKKEISVFDGIMNGLNDAIAYVQGDEKTCRVTRVSDVIVEPLPEIDNLTIQKIRLSLQLSQKVFADVVGVSKKTVEAWESGRNKPEGAARRLIGIISNNKDVLHEIVHSK